MSKPDPHLGEAYIIEDDGTKTAIPIGFADGKGSQSSAAAQSVNTESTRQPFAGTQSVNTESPNRPFTSSVHGGTGPRSTSYSSGQPFGRASYTGQGTRVIFTTFPPTGGRAYSGTYTAPQQPNSMPNQSGRPLGRFKLHLGRRIFGLFLVLIGLPMLILPGPGLLVILMGLSLVLAP